MPTFETPEPISVQIETGGGSVRLVATDRVDTVVEGTAVRLDIATASGAFVNTLQLTDGPGRDDETLVLGVRSGSGDVTIRRAGRASEHVSAAAAT